MKVTDKMIEIFGNAWRAEAMKPGNHLVPGARRRAGLQAALDHLFPPPGDNPLASNTVAAGRLSTELLHIRAALTRVELAEHAVSQLVAAPSTRLTTPDPEAEQILTTLRSVREALAPWASKGGW